MINAAFSKFSFLLIAGVLTSTFQFAAAGEPKRVYHNQLKPLKNAKPLLADYPEFIQPIEEVQRYEAPLLVDDEDADLSVRAWRFSYNAPELSKCPIVFALTRRRSSWFIPGELTMVKVGKLRNRPVPVTSVRPQKTTWLPGTPAQSLIHF